MFQWYPKDFEMIVIEKGKIDFDVLERIYEYESRTKKLNLKQKHEDDIRWRFAYMFQGIMSNNSKW